MKVTLWIADIMAEFIKSCEDKIGTEYEIDLWGWDNIEFERTDAWLHMWRNNKDGWACGMWMWKTEINKIKEVLLDRIWVYEDEIE